MLILAKNIWCMYLVKDIGSYLLLMRQVVTRPDRWNVFFQRLKTELYAIGVDSFGIVAIISLFRIVDLTMNEDWQKISGGEHFWIAKSIANGQGYSFKAQNRWLFHDFETPCPSRFFGL